MALLVQNAEKFIKHVLVYFQKITYSMLHVKTSDLTVHFCT